MASDEHKRLAGIIKGCHEHLRLLSKLHGPELAWFEHVKDTKRLREYANAMHKLAIIWEYNTTNPDLLARSRVQWVVDYCISYFFTEKIYLEKRERERRLLESWNDCNLEHCEYLEFVPDKIHVLDVGSCFNPFINIPQFETTAIDLYPATDNVLQADFLQINVKNKKSIDIDENGSVKSLPRQFYDCVVFSLLLEYIPCSSKRLDCCSKAYELLKPEGILIIITPDSQHVGKNAMIMKNWRYTLATMGFQRIRFEKLPHITCMSFRKASDPRIAYRWAEKHREQYMQLTIDIPQDTKDE